MTDYYMPTLTLNGEPLDTTARVEGVSVLSGLVFDWGAPDWFADLDGGTLTVSMLDPDGVLLALVGGLGGDALEVGRADGTLWKGTVQDATALLVEIPRAHDPSESRYVWRVTVRAVDLLGELKANRKHGPGYSAADLATDQNRHWGPHHIATRRTEIAARCPAPILWATPQPVLIRTNPAPAPAQPIPQLTGYEKNANVSLLTVIHDTMRADQLLSRPYYQHSQGRIVQAGEPTADNLIRLEATAGVADTAAASPNITLLSGGKLMPDGGTVSVAADPASRITTVEHNGAEYPVSGGGYVARNAQRATGAKANDTATATFDMQLDAFYWTPPAGADISTGERFKLSFLYAIYSRVAPGRISYRQPVTEAANPDAMLELLRPEPVTRYRSRPRTGGGTYEWYELAAYFLTHSLTNLAPTAHGFAITGGTLSYTAERGWEHQFMTAPIPDLIEPGRVKLGGLTLTAKIGDTAPGLRLADLERLSTV